MQDNILIADLRPQLEQPFPETAVRFRPGSRGEQLAYVPAALYVARMNQVFASSWDFKVVHHQILETEIMVIVQISAAGVTKQDVGGAAIQRSRESGEVIGLADAIKSAVSDGLKRTARLFGIGLGLYGGDTEEKSTQKKSGNGYSKGNGTPPPANGSANGNGAGRLTSRQHGAILSIGQSQSLTPADLDDMALERFNRKLQFLSKSDASSLISELQAG